MKSKRLVILCVFIIVLVAVFNSHALAAYLSLEATTNGSSIPADFSNNEYVYLNIIAVQEAGDPAGIAGFAFTLSYPSEALSAPSLDDQGIPQNSNDIMSRNFTYSYSDQTSTETTYRANEPEPGQIYLAGVAIDPTTGGAVHGVGSVAEIVLLTIRFKVKADATDGYYLFVLDQTEIMAEAAGHGNDVDDDGVYEPGDGDTKGKISVLVGAMAQGQPGWDNFDCSTSPCAFPVLMGDQTEPIDTLEIEICQDLDGNEILDSEEVEIDSLIFHYYGAILDREPDDAGRENWNNEIKHLINMGIDVKEGFISLAKVFFNSQEYLQYGKSDENYVTDLYQAFFNREPDPGGLSDWTDYLSNGGSRAVLLNYFVYSTEFLNYMQERFPRQATNIAQNLVNDFYRGFLSRKPDDGGFDDWLRQMRGAQCDGEQVVKDLSFEIVDGFKDSGEYSRRNRSDREFLEDLYDGIMRRGCQTWEIDYWEDRLKNGLSREAVLQSFVDSPEFQNRVQLVIEEGCEVDNLIEAFVTRFYRICLGREPEPAGLMDWVGRLKSGEMSGADVARGIVNSLEFGNQNVTDEWYLEILYQAFFGRSSDSGGYDSWLRDLRNSGNRQEVLDGFIYSAEFENLCNRYGIRPD